MSDHLELARILEKQRDELRSMNDPDANELSLEVDDWATMATEIGHRAAAADGLDEQLAQKRSFDQELYEELGATCARDAALNLEKLKKQNERAAVALTKIAELADARELIKGLESN